MRVRNQTSHACQRWAHFLNPETPQGALALVLNGGSSSGKSTLAIALQQALPGSWLRLGVDTLIEALPPRLLTGEEGIAFGNSGEIGLGNEFTRIESAWMQGVAAILAAGVSVIVEDNFLGGPVSQDRWRVALNSVDVVWVGVRCDPEVASARERRRGDRAEGMARLQAISVHEGIEYDVAVDSSGGLRDDDVQQVTNAVLRRATSRALTGSQGE